jgi:hypothetical protein
MSSVSFHSAALFRSKFFPLCSSTTLPSVLAYISDVLFLFSSDTSLHSFSLSTRLPFIQRWWHIFHYRILPQDCRTRPA